MNEIPCSVVDIIPIRKHVQYVPVPLDVHIVLVLRLPRPELHLFLDQCYQLLPREGKKVDDLVDAAEKLVPPKMVL